MRPALIVEGLRKAFQLHNQGGVEIVALDGVGLTVRPGECVALTGPSGVGKSTLLRCVYGAYSVDAGRVMVLDNGAMADVASGGDRLIQRLRRHTIGYVSQFLRVLPRVAAADVVAAPALRAGAAPEAARARAEALLERLALPRRLWGLPPQTFSGGEQQRVNIARAFVHDYALLLLDEPSASLDADNRRRVAALVTAAMARGAAVLGVFHDLDMAEAVGARRFTMEAPVRSAA